MTRALSVWLKAYFFFIKNLSRKLKRLSAPFLSDIFLYYQSALSFPCLMFSVWMGWRRWKERGAVWSKVHKIFKGYPIFFFFFIHHSPPEGDYLCRGPADEAVRRCQIWRGLGGGGAHVWNDTFQGNILGQFHFKDFRRQMKSKFDVNSDNARGTDLAHCPPEKNANKRHKEKNHQKKTIFKTPIFPSCTVFTL